MQALEGLIMPIPEDGYSEKNEILFGVSTASILNGQCPTALSRHIVSWDRRGVDAVKFMLNEEATRQQEETATTETKTLEF